jgi:hypothetical protein
VLTLGHLGQDDQNITLKKSKNGTDQGGPTDPVLFCVNSNKSDNWNKGGYNIQHSTEVKVQTWPDNQDELCQIHYCLKCFDSKKVAADPSDTEIHSVVQGEIKKTPNRLSQKNTIGLSSM